MTIDAEENAEVRGTLSVSPVSVVITVAPAARIAALSTACRITRS